MSFRLGQYECSSCGHTESTLAEPIAKLSTRRSLGGSDSDKSHVAGNQHYNVTGTVYGAAESPSGSSERVLNPGLELEKKLLMLLYIITMLMNGIWASQSGLRFYFDAAGVVVFYIASALIGLAILYFVLQSDQTWLKYGCMGCAGLNVLIQFITLIVPSSMASSGMFSEDVTLMSGLLSLIYAGWLTSILYRDVTQ